MCLKNTVMKIIIEIVLACYLANTVIVLLAISLLWITPTSSQIFPFEALSPIQVPICCDVSSKYQIGFDVCVNSSDVVHQDPRPQITNAAQNNYALNINYYNLFHCDDGLVANISMEFRLLENGSLFILSPSEILIPEDEFCIEEFQTLNPKEPTALVARFCAPDPCIGRKCISKCCPNGMMLHETVEHGFKCQKVTFNYSSNNIRLRNEYGVIIPPSELKEIPAIRDGAALECPDEIFDFVPDSGEYFSILPNGSIFIPFYTIGEMESDQYCIDHLLKDENTLSGDHIAIICVPTSITSRDKEEESWIFLAYPYFLFISSIFLIVTFIVYAIIPEIRNIHGISIMCHVAALAVMYIGLGIIQINSESISGRWCTALAFVTHFAFLSSFTWLSVMSFDIWWTFRNVRPRVMRSNNMYKRRRLIFYCIYSWIIPLIIALTGIVADDFIEQIPDKRFWFDTEEERHSYLSSRPFKIVRPHFGEGWCWFPFDLLAPSAVYLYGPIGFMIMVNIIFFVLTVLALRRASIDTALAAGKTKAWQKFRIIFCIFILMGLSWIFQIVSYAIGLSEFHNFLHGKSGKGGALFLRGQSKVWITIDAVIFIINGVAIFLMFVCKATIWNRLQSKFPILKYVIGCFPACFRMNKERVIILNPQSNHQESSGVTNITESIHNQGNLSVEAHNMQPMQ